MFQIQTGSFWSCSEFSFAGPLWSTGGWRRPPEGNSKACETPNSNFGNQQHSVEKCSLLFKDLSLV